MNTDDFGDLLDGLRAIHAFTAEVSRELSFRLPEPQEALKRLNALIPTIGRENVVKPRHCPDEYRVQWQEFILGKRTSLENRAVRFLCWEPKVATDGRFHTYLDASGTELGSRALQGLVRTCHQGWSLDVARGEASASIRRRLTKFSGSNRVIHKWKENIRLIASIDAPRRFGSEMANKPEPWSIAEECGQWAIPEHSPFIAEAVRVADEICRMEICKRPVLIKYLLREVLPWLETWQAADFKQSLGSWILSSHADKIEEVRDGLKQLALNKFGDPRLPFNARRWFGVQPEARGKLLEWLSRADIAFFFEHVLPKGRDPHGRKDFWLKYVKQVKQSRPLLCRDDKLRLQALPKSILDKVGHYGVSNGATSVFLLDFGSLVAIEFAEYGNACYLYSAKAVAKVLPDFWTIRPLAPSTLRSRVLCTENIRHDKIWKYKLENILAMNGIRPDRDK